MRVIRCSSQSHSTRRGLCRDAHKTSAATVSRALRRQVRACIAPCVSGRGCHGIVGGAARKSTRVKYMYVVGAQEGRLLYTYKMRYLLCVREERGPGRMCFWVNVREGQQLVSWYRYGMTDEKALVR